MSTATLFAIDMLTNLTDYGFHVYIGRVLHAQSFALVQSVNAVVLVLVAVGSVLQPVVARYVAAESAETSRGIFQHYLKQSTPIAFAIVVIGLLLRSRLSELLNLPFFAVNALIIFALIALLRPIMAGMLQGRQQFVAFGLVRTAFAFGRFAAVIAVLFLLDRGTLAGVIAYPIGGAISIVAALLFLGRGVWGAAEPVDNRLINAGWRLSGAAFVAYAAFMLLQTVDLLWVNRSFAPDIAGTYSSATVLRRVLAVFPGAVVVILFPRIVERIKQGKSPNQLVNQALVLIGGSTAALTLIYFLLGDTIVALMFGDNYPNAAPLLGWMGVAMVGYSIGTIWLNVFLATRPWWFVICLVVTVAVQIGWLIFGRNTITSALQASILAGWISAIGGGLLYLVQLRNNAATHFS